MKCMNESASAACAGACAGSLSKTVLYPLELIRRMLQVQGSSLVASVPTGSFYVCAGFWHCLKIIFRKEGVSGYYKGFMLSAIKSMIGTTLNFFTYEFILAIYSPVRKSIDGDV
ncbi:mitochondrial thiamine pyrophosphate carrier-like [Ctenocephalides felis]|nr:mitochondrial thiamine pyrophosphate carrier-like [Ctenocephalides felis]